jgi:hypothetical protein
MKHVSPAEVDEKAEKTRVRFFTGSSKKVVARRNIVYEYIGQAEKIYGIIHAAGFAVVTPQGSACSKI